MGLGVGRTALRWVAVAAFGLAACVLGPLTPALLMPIAFLVLTGVLLQALRRSLADGPPADHLLAAADLGAMAIACYGVGTVAPGAAFRWASAVAIVYAALVLGRVWGATAADARAQRSSREARTLLEIQEALTSTLDVREVMGRIVSRIGEHVRAPRCSILVVDERRGRCFVVAASDNPSASMMEVDLGKYPEIRRALATREPVVVEDVANDPLVEPVRSILLDQGYRSMMVLPLVFGREVLGTLFLRASRSAPFSEAEVQFCRVAAAASANALKNALLYQDVAHEAARHRETGEKLRRVLDGTPDLIVATDGAGRVTTFNRAAEALTGVPVHHASGRPLAELLPDLDAQALADPRPREVVLRRPEGGAVELNVVGSRLHDDAGSDAGSVWIGRDVTEMRRVEKSLAQAERLSSLGEVVAGVAHELNNPLSSVLGYGQLLAPSWAGTPAGADIDRIVESARRCQRIVQNLLSFSRKHLPAKRLGDLNACLRKVIDLKSYHLRTSGIGTSLELEPDLPPASFDAHQIEQVVLNLLNNAEQAILAAGRSGRVVLRTRAVPGFLCIEVEDDGPGVPETIRHRVFDPFFTTKEAGQGTGLGLSVSYGIVQEHGGRIELREDRAGKGACFAVYLPAAAAIERVEDGGPAVAQAPTPAGPLEGRRILVADDEPMVLDLMRRVLESDGALVTSVENGRAAWERILEQDFDLVVTDLRMPELDGRALYERVVAERPEMIRRFVFATGDLVRPETVQFLESLPGRVIRKPLDVDAIRRVLGQMLPARAV